MTVGLVWEYVTDLFTGAHTEGFSGIRVGMENFTWWMGPMKARPMKAMYSPGDEAG